MEKMLWLQRVGGGCRFSKVSRKRVNDRRVYHIYICKRKGYACGPWSAPPAGELVQPGGGETLVLLAKLHHLERLLGAVDLNPAQV